MSIKWNKGSNGVIESTWFGTYELKVHKYAGYGETLFLTTFESSNFITSDKIELLAKNMKQARKEAIEVFKAKIMKDKKILDKALDELESSKIIKMEDAR